jgi:hypothetical protein
MPKPLSEWNDTTDWTPCYCDECNGKRSLADHTRIALDKAEQEDKDKKEESTIGRGGHRTWA